MGQDQSTVSIPKNNMFICGENKEYQFGIGFSNYTTLREINNFKQENIKKVCCGPNFTIVLTDRDEVYGTGSNIYGVLGLDSFSQSDSHHFNINRFVKLPISFKVQHICCCRSMVAIVSNGYLKANRETLLNRSIISNSSSPTQLNAYGQMFFWSGGDISISGCPINKKFTPIYDWNFNIMGKVKFFESSPFSSFFIVVTEFNRVYFSGQNCSGQFGNGEEKRNFKSLYQLTDNLFPTFKGIKHVACGSKHCIIVTDDNELYSSGSNQYFQLGHSNNAKQDTFQKPATEFQGKKIELVKCGENYTMVYLSNGDLYACGANHFGQLLNNQTQRKVIFHKILTDRSLVSLSCGNNFSLYLTRNCQVMRAGSNEYGQLFSTKNGFQMQTTKVDKSMRLFGLTCSNNLTILYKQKDNDCGEIYLRRYCSQFVKSSPNNNRQQNKVLSPTKKRKKNYLMYRSIHDHFSFMFDIASSLKMENATHLLCDIEVKILE